ncbi:alpha/beta fold hydrolase [Chromobacterium subtsugae]|uniref:Alpha/beta fold hydrolase n=1 Tax=Chromobacterium subtsugae TaxID=251747 RepID=A0ABS7F8J7_9NEIS|nr:MULTISPECIES: alpha/beta hydrolase [Chromobacterium]KUM05327.1 alpha/beta hydrolase [Chromobacterium subtsugae]KZE86615.1 alpha/beta hydrolase [Chromobacterium sp. F49]MBW7565056.1 alpha/beta fold hydrolase [Chromobacterium subtsugae]MBW8286416.1 alpha/beta fold hydrolase [Chromobacterium subtsugae]OBU87734.1 alpha/beta hydrolase [Chromobacterium subtsugae]
MAYYTHRNRRLYYLAHGDGPAALLLHGICNSGRAWLPQLEALAAAGYRVIAPDFAGHGASPRLDASYGVANLAADCVALLDQLDLAQAHIVGLSLGGMAAQQLALDAPSRVRSLTVACSFPSTATDEARQMLAGWAQTLREPDGPLKRLEQSWPRNLNAAFRASPAGQALYWQWQAQAAQADGASQAHVCEGLADYHLAENLSAIAAPALYLAGECDEVSPPALSQWMAAQVPGARFATLPGAAHVANVDSAAAFNAALLAFLRQH